MKLLIIILLLLATPAFAVTNNIARTLRGVRYADIPTTVRYARNNHSGNALSCAQFAYRIRSVEPSTKIYLTSGAKHVIAVVIVNGRKITYSNGKIVKNGSFEIISEIK